MSHTEESVFAEALEKGDPQERAAYLDHVCANDPELRAGVEALLSAYMDAICKGLRNMKRRELLGHIRGFPLIP